MKIFTPSNSKWDSKVNFVDENNVFLGYDLSQGCCEDADWYITATSIPNASKLEVIPDLTNYRFDTSFFQEISESESINGIDEGGEVIFRITDGIDELFIHIYNAHNGYYGHGFEFINDSKNEVIQKGTL